jgi:hypothetical protein
MHGLWTLPFLLIGLLVLVIRRENRDIFLLAWLISLYLVLHRDIIGKLDFLHRSLSASAHIFAPITVIGILSLPSLIKIPKMYRLFLKYGAAILVVALILIYNAPQAYSTLNKAYDSPLLRLSPAQIEVSEWLKNEIPEDQNVSIAGTPGQLFQKIWWMSSFSHRTSFYFEGFCTWKTYASNREQAVKNTVFNDVMVFDYTDILLLSDRTSAEKWFEVEQKYFAAHIKPVYDKNNIRIYKFGKNDDLNYSLYDYCWMLEKP